MLRDLYGSLRFLLLQHDISAQQMRRQLASFFWFMVTLHSDAVSRAMKECVRACALAVDDDKNIANSIYQSLSGRNRIE